MQQGSNSECRFGSPGEAPQGLEGAPQGLPASSIGVQDLNLGAQQLLKQLVDELYDQYGQRVSERFAQLRGKISQRQLYVMFEPTLNCNPLSDHQKPKDVLPLFQTYLQDAETQLLALFDADLPQTIFDYYLAILTSQITSQSQLQLKLDQTQEELSRFQTQTTVQADIIKTLQQTILQEKQKHTRETSLLRDQLLAKARYQQQYQPDFTDIQRYQEVLAMPDISADLEQFRQKTAKQIRLDNRPLIQENKELKEMHVQLSNKVRQSEQARKLIADECDAATAALDQAEGEIRAQKQALGEMDAKIKAMEEDAGQHQQQVQQLEQEREKLICEFKGLAAVNRQLHQKLNAITLDDSKQRLSAAFEKIDRQETEISEQKKALLQQQLRIQLLETSAQKNGLTKFEEQSREQQRTIEEMRQVNSKLFEEVKNLRQRKNRGGEFSSAQSRDEMYSPQRGCNKAVQTELQIAERATSSLGQHACSAGIASRNEQQSAQKIKGQNKMQAESTDQEASQIIQHQLNVSFGSRKGGRQANIRLVNGGGLTEELAIDLNIEDAALTDQKDEQPADTQSSKRAPKFRIERKGQQTNAVAAAKQDFRGEKSGISGAAAREAIFETDVQQDKREALVLKAEQEAFKRYESLEKHFAKSSDDLDQIALEECRKPETERCEQFMREHAVDCVEEQEPACQKVFSGSDLLDDQLLQHGQERAEGSLSALGQRDGVSLDNQVSSSQNEAKLRLRAGQLGTASEAMPEKNRSRKSVSSPVANEVAAGSPEGTEFALQQDPQTQRTGSQPLDQHEALRGQKEKSDFFDGRQGAERSMAKDCLADSFAAVDFSKIKQTDRVIAQLAAQMSDADVLEVIVNPQEIVNAGSKHRSMSVKLQMEAAAGMYNEEEIHTIFEEDGAQLDGISVKSTKSLSDELRAQECELNRIRAQVSENNSLCAETTQSAIFAFSQLFDPKGQELSVVAKKQLIDEIDRQKMAVQALIQRIPESADEFGGAAELDRLLASELEIQKMRGQLINYLLADDTLLDQHSLDPCYKDEMRSLAAEKPQLPRQFIGELAHGFFSPFQVRKLLSTFHQHDSSVQALVYDVYDADLLLALLNNRLTVQQACSLLGALANTEVQQVLCKDQRRAEAFVAAQQIPHVHQKGTGQTSPNIFQLSQNIKECLQIYHHWDKQAVQKADVVLSEDFLDRLERGEDIRALVGDLKTMLDSSLGCLLSTNVGLAHASNLRRIYQQLEELKKQPTRRLLEETLLEIAELPVSSILSKGLSEPVRKTVSNGLRRMKSHLGANALLDEQVAEDMAHGNVSRRNMLNICNVLYDDRSMASLAFPEDEPARSKETLDGLVNVLYNPQLPRNAAKHDKIKQIAQAFYSPEVIAGLFGQREEAYEKGMRCCNVVNATLNGAVGGEYEQCAPFQFTVLRGRSIVGGGDSSATVLAFKDRTPQVKTQRNPAVYRVRLNARNDFEQAFYGNSGAGSAKTAEYTKNHNLRKNALRSKYLVQVPQHYTVDIAGLLRVEAQGRRIAQTGKQAAVKAPGVLPRQARHERENRQQDKAQKQQDADIVLRLLGNGYVSDGGFEK